MLSFELDLEKIESKYKLKSIFLMGDQNNPDIGRNFIQPNEGILNPNLFNEFRRKLEPCFNTVSEVCFDHLNTNFRNLSENRIIDAINNIHNQNNQFRQEMINLQNQNQQAMTTQLGQFRVEMVDQLKQVNKKLDDLYVRSDFHYTRSIPLNRFCQYLDYNQIFLSYNQLYYLAGKISTLIAVPIDRDTRRSRVELLQWFDDNFVQIERNFRVHLDVIKNQQDYPSF